MLCDSFDAIVPHQPSGDYPLGQARAFDAAKVFPSGQGDDETLLDLDIAMISGDVGSVARMLQGGPDLRPRLLVASVRKASLPELVFMAGTARHIGVPSTVVWIHGGGKSPRGLVERIRTQGIASASRHHYDKGLVLPLGSPGPQPGAEPDHAAGIKAVRDAVARAIAAGRHREALHWLMAHKRCLPVELRHAFSLEETRIYLLLSRYGRSLDALSAWLALHGPDDPDYRVMASYRVYLYLVQGMTGQAREYLAANRAHLEGSADSHYYDLMLTLADQGSVDEAALAVKNPGPGLIDEGRPAFLFQEYLYAWGRSEAVPGVSARPAGFAANRREAMKSLLFRGPDGAAFDSLRELALLCGRGVDAANWLLRAEGFLAGEDSATAGAALLCLASRPPGGPSGEALAGLASGSWLRAQQGLFWLDLAPLVRRFLESGRGADLFSDEAKAAAYARAIESLRAPLLRSRLFFMIAADLLRQGRHESAYEWAHRAAYEGMPAGDALRLRLLLAEIETTGGLDGAAVKGMTSLDLASASPGDRYRLAVLKTRHELRRLAALPSVSAARGAEFEALFHIARTMLENDPTLTDDYGLRESTSLIHDQYVAYKMKTGQHGQALAALFHRNMLLAPDRRAAAFPPEDHVSRIDSLMGALRPGELLFCAAAVGDDIFVWTMAGGSRRARVIEKGYPQAMKLIQTYHESAQGLVGYESVSSGLAALFPELGAAGDGTVYMLVDRRLFALPLEIAGAGETLAARRHVVYLSDLPAVYDAAAPAPVSILRAGQVDCLQSRLEDAALAVAGLPPRPASSRGGAVLHVFGALDDDTLSSLCQGAGCSGLYLSDAGRGPAAGYDAASRFWRRLPLVVNCAPEKDINCAYFVETFYAELGRGASMTVAHARALAALMDRRSMKHPAWWQGIRLVVPGIPVHRPGR
jgi:hypothetical protein